MQRFLIYLTAVFFLFNLPGVGKVKAIGSPTMPVVPEISDECVAPPPGIVGWWQGEGNGNDFVSSNNGVVVNASFVNGVVGQAFSFDPESYPYGTYTGIQIPDSPAYVLTNSLTIEGWVRPRGNGYIIFWRGDSRPGLDPYTLSMQDDNELDFNITDANGNAATIKTTLNYDQWTYVAAILDSGTGTMSLYTNGILAAQTVTSVRPMGELISDQHPGIGIGNLNDGINSFPFIGDIDEISLYNRALSVNEITAIYNAGSAGKCTSDSISASVPTIFKLIPAIGTNGALVNIAGTNFSSLVSSNVVYFGAVQAGVLSASLTNLTVRVPVGATYAPVTVTVDGLTADSGQIFEPTFLGNGSAISTTSFGPRLDLPTGNGPNKIVIADIDGDGKPDLIVANDYNNTISIYRNISTGGVLTTNSFAPAVVIATPPGQYSPMDLVVADVDGDGKLDIIADDYNNSTVSVYRNTSTPGNISSNTFAVRVDFVTGSQPQGIEVRDIDGDGRPDILVANSGDGTVSILRNTSVTGSLTTNSFAPKIDITTGSGCDCILVGDLDGDGKPDVIAANQNDGTLSLLRNLSSPGEITTNSFAPKVDITVMSGLIRAAIGDLDGDGKLDIAVASYFPQTLSVLHNISTPGDFSFDSPVNYPLGGRGHSPIFSDLNGDGKPDIAVVTELNSLLSIFQNTSTPGSFTNNSLASRVDFSTGWNAWGVAAGDLDGDGRPDIVFCNQYDSTISIYQNQTLLLNSPPVITSQPVGQTVLAGSNVVFSVTATGGNPLTYQWKLNGANISKATNATLTLADLHSNQSGNYQVRVSNSFGSVTSASALLTVIAQNLLVYNYSGSEKVTTAGQEFSYNYTGEMFFNPANTNGVFIGWATINNKKQYWVSPFSDYRMINIPGAAKHVYTVLGKAGSEVDSGGQPHVWSFLHTGLNATLTIATRKTFSFPNTFSCDDTQVYPDPQTGNMILRSAVSAYTYASSATQTANNNGSTLADLVNAQTASLIRLRYQQQ